MLQIIDNPMSFSDGIVWIFVVGGLLIAAFVIVALVMLMLARPINRRLSGNNET